MPRIDDIEAGGELPRQQRRPDEVQLFLYDAALWNAHRIHYDRPYATEEEGYPDLVVPGPLMGDWLAQCVLEWLDGEGRLTSLEYSNRRAAYVGETLVVGGTVAAVDAAAGRVELELWVKNVEGEVVTPGTASAALGTS